MSSGISISKHEEHSLNHNRTVPQSHPLQHFSGRDGRKKHDIKEEETAADRRMMWPHILNIALHAQVATSIHWEVIQTRSTDYKSNFKVTSRLRDRQVDRAMQETQTRWHTHNKFQEQKDLACQREGLWIGQTELETEISGIYKHDTSCLLQMEWGIKNQSIFRSKMMKWVRWKLS